MNLNYISYEKKMKSLDLKSSIYIINADDANEIKLVVNNIIDWLKREGTSVNNIYKYVKINVPKLNEGKSYDLIFQVSETKTFDKCDNLIYSENSEKFKIFKDNKFSNCTHLFDSTDADKQILVDISELISDTKIYCRYYFKDNRFETPKKTFVLGNNDFQKLIEESPIPVILIGEEQNELLDNLKNCSKKDAEKIYNKLKEYNNIDETINKKTYKTYLKYERIPNNISGYCLENQIEIKIINDTLIDTTNITNLSYAQKSNSGLLNIGSISGTISIDSLEIEFNRIIAIKSTQKRSYSLKNPTVVPSGVLDVKKTIENGENEIDIVQDEDLISAGFSDEITINEKNVLLNDNVKKSFDTFIHVKSNDNKISQEFPLRIKIDDLQKINLKLYESAFSESKENVPFEVIGTTKTNQTIDITQQCQFFVNKKIKINEINSRFSFSISNDIANGEYTFTVKYLNFVDSAKIIVSKKELIGFDFFISKWNDAIEEKTKNIEIEPTADSTDKNDNWLRCIGLLKYFDGTNETEEVVALPSSVSISSTLPNIQKESVDDYDFACLKVSPLVGRIYNALIAVTAEYQGFKSTCFVNVVKDKIKKLSIKEVDNDLSVFDTDSEYDISVSALYKSGKIVDISNNSNLSLNAVGTTKHQDILQAMHITTSPTKYSRPIVINGVFNSVDDFIEVDKCFYVMGYGFTGTTITDNDPNNNNLDIKSGETKDYYTYASYDNGTTRFVSADFSLENLDNGELNYLTYVISDDKKKISISTKKSMINKCFRLSSYYAEPGYENVESETSLKIIDITISGGFDLALSGLISTASGTIDGTISGYNEIPFNTSATFIDSIDPSDFSSPVTYSKTIETSENPNIEINRDFLNSINNESGNEYQFVEITSENDFKVTMPCNCNTIEPVFLDSGKTYSFTFYNILSSMRCAFNSYSSMKEPQKIEKHFNSTTRAKLSDFVIGNKNSYYNAIVKRTDSNTPSESKKINDEYDFSAGDYTIKFIPISMKEKSINTYKTFEINEEIDDNFVIGIKNPTLGESIQILDIIPTFETSTGKQYMQKLSYFAQEDIWIPDEIPLKATKLVSILVAFALVEEAE